MVDWNNIAVTDAVPGSVNGSEAESARETIRENLNTEGTSGERPNPPKPDKSARPGKIAKNLEKLYGTVGASVFPFDQKCGTTILENAPQMAKSLEDLANENAAVKRVLERLAETSAWGTVFAAHAPVVLALATHHGPAMAAKARPKPADKARSDDVSRETSAPSPGVGQYVPPTTPEDEPL